MNRDIRHSDAYRRAARVFGDALSVGSGRPYDLVDLAVSPDGGRVAASGLVLDRLEGLPEQRLMLLDLASGGIEALTSGACRDRLPRWDPAGERVAFLSDAASPYDFQLAILTLATGAVARFPIEGYWVESLHWSVDGRDILLLAAGKGAELAGAQGAIATPQAAEDVPGWAPQVDDGAAEAHWRTLWVLDAESGTARRVSPQGVNVWEACWCGTGRIACIASDAPEEEAWYRADLRLIDTGEGTVSTLHVPADQLGWISGSPDGRIAVVEAVCSDRMLVAGRLLVGDADGLSAVDTGDVDVTFTAWQEDAVLYAGLRGFETVLGVYGADGARAEIWQSDERTIGGALYPDAAPGPRIGQAVFMAEGHLSPPTLTIVAPGEAVRTLAVVEALPADRAHPGATMTRVAWPAADGLGIQGWLLTPAGEGPYPLVMDLHGGPIWRTRPRHVGRGGYAGALLRMGYAVFQPNPRGSSGQGQDFARLGYGDAGGADAADLLAGLDHLVARGIARPDRIGVIGGSYGGFLSAWLITQDARFAAAVAIAPVADWTSLRLTSHVPSSIEMMLGGDRALYASRSPITHADRVRTPTLIVTGALDRSTPPGQGVELHNAMRRAGAQSVLLTYPGEGHGVRQFPAVIDFIARVTDWFDRHMPAHDEGHSDA